MCFSATASFVTAGVTGIAGLLAMTRVTHKRELVLGNLPPAVATHLRKSKDAAAQRPARTKKKSRAKSRA